MFFKTLQSSYALEDGDDGAFSTIIFYFFT